MLVNPFFYCLRNVNDIGLTVSLLLVQMNRDVVENEHILFATDIVFCNLNKLF